MVHPVFTRASGGIAKAFVIVLVVVCRRPIPARAQTPLPAPGRGPAQPQLLPPGGPGATVVVEQATMEQILARLAAAEAEIRTLRQGPANGTTGALPAPAGEPTAPAPSLLATDGCAAPASDDKKIHADSAKYLIPLSTDCGDITFKPGLRIQSRYLYDDFNDNNDFFIRRFRLKSSGNIFDFATYGSELKVDSTGKFGTAKNPDAIVENAWVDFAVVPDDTYFRVGLYDIPFSYNALTSDSKLLFMDRTLIKEYLTTFGLTDNTIGMMLHGRPQDGRFEYAVGIFDNVEFERFTGGTREADHLMPAGRIVANLLDPASPPGGYADYQESYLGQGERLAIGANAAYLSEAIDGADIFDIIAWGVDIFYNSGPWVVQGEYDWFELNGAGDDVVGDGWYVQAGYFLNCCWELAARYQQLDPDRDVFTDRQRLTSIGVNYYFWKHNLKVQADYTFKDEQGPNLANNIFQIQLQLDY